MARVIKRDGSEKEFEPYKIKAAINKANKETHELSEEEINNITNAILLKCKKFSRALNVEEIQEIVEDVLMQYKAYQTAKHYIRYRYQKTIDRRQNTTDSQILTTVNLDNEEGKQENGWYLVSFATQW